MNAPLSVPNPMSNTSSGQVPAFPLGLAAAGEQLEIVGLRGGAGLEKRLAAMGLRPGSRFEVRV
ncbi:MAG: FeoA family protein [Gammaproteobacteria bacterium]